MSKSNKINFGLILELINFGLNTKDAILLFVKILQARLQQYVNRELPDVQAGFRKGRGTRGQIADILFLLGGRMQYWICHQPFSGRDTAKTVETMTTWYSCI